MRPDNGCASPGNQFLFCSIVTHMLYKLANQIKSRGYPGYIMGIRQQSVSGAASMWLSYLVALKIWIDR